MGVWDGTIHAEIQVRDVPRAEDARLIYWTLELSANYGFFWRLIFISTSGRCCWPALHLASPFFRWQRSI